LRLAASVANFAMCFYIYAAYLVQNERESLGRMSILDGSPHTTGVAHQKLATYLSAGDYDGAFESLKSFTFSLAMLDRLSLFFFVGAPVSVVFFALERDRVRWLQAAVMERLPVEQAKIAARYLEVYLWCLVIMFVFILLLVPFHLDRPRAHYPVAGVALGLGFSSICLYLAAPIDFERLTGGDDALMLWASRQRSCVRPVLKLQALLHVFTLASAVLKGEQLGDDRAALLFGVFETLTILGYQVMQGVFVLDDVVVGSGLPSMAAPASEGPARQRASSSNMLRQRANRCQVECGRART